MYIHKFFILIGILCLSYHNKLFINASEPVPVVPQNRQPMKVVATNNNLHHDLWPNVLPVKHNTMRFQETKAKTRHEIKARVHMNMRQRHKAREHMREEESIPYHRAEVTPIPPRHHSNPMMDRDGEVVDVIGKLKDRNMDYHSLDPTATDDASVLQDYNNARNNLPRFRSSSTNSSNSTNTTVPSQAEDELMTVQRIMFAAQKGETVESAPAGTNMNSGIESTQLLLAKKENIRQQQLLMEKAVRQIRRIEQDTLKNIAILKMKFKQEMSLQAETRALAKRQQQQQTNSLKT